MDWVINNGCIVFQEDANKSILSFSEFIDINNMSYPRWNDKTVIKPSEALNLDLSLIDYFSSLIIRVYIPTDFTKKRPVLSLICKDPEFVERKMVEVPLQNYYIMDHILYVFSEDSVSEVNKFFQKFDIGVMSFHHLSEIYKNYQDVVEIVVSDDCCIPNSIKDIQTEFGDIELFPYQKNGVKWLLSVLEDDCGCILADDMGLGKTFQVIAVIANRKKKGMSLIIAPNSLLENWRREFFKLTPQIKVYIHSGRKRKYDYRSFYNYDVIITSYDTISSDFAVFEQIKWREIVLDEAQAIKNNDSKRSQIIRELPKDSGIAVSGTPFENHVSDIWSLFDFCYRGLLGDSVYSFKKEYSDSIESAEELEQIISPLILRRLVKDVKDDLPDVIKYSEALLMTDREAERYEVIRGEQSKVKKPSLATLAEMRQFCALPSLIDNTFKAIPIDEMSAKFSRLFEILSEIYLMHEKVLIFTSYIGAQLQIKQKIESTYGEKAYVLNGSIEQAERQSIVDDFSQTNGFSTLIINPTVGGTGLNITSANHVIFYTLEWNPALEDQCLARAFRIGQTKTVFVHRLFYSGTVEEIIDERLNRKREIASTLVQGIDGSQELDIQRALQLSPFIELNS